MIDMQYFTNKKNELLINVNQFVNLQERKEVEYESYEEQVFLTWIEARGYKDCTRFQRPNEEKPKNCTGCLKPIGIDEICAETGCPPFENVGTGACGFEARKMLSAKWVVTDIDMSDDDNGYPDAFWRIFKYFNKANSLDSRISEGIYLLNRWYVDDDFRIVSAQMAAHIPDDAQENPPLPTDSQVEIVRWDDAITYNRAFGGRNSGGRKNIRRHLRYLRRALKEEGIEWVGGMLMTMEYVRPGCGKQRNEVMLYAA